MNTETSVISAVLSLNKSHILKAHTVLFFNAQHVSCTSCGNLITDLFVLQTLLDMMEGYRYFGEALDRSCNIHTDQWNIRTMKKALPLIDRRIFRWVREMSKDLSAFNGAFLPATKESDIVF